MPRPLASRFFAAFYRWNRQKPSHCLAAPRNSRFLLTAVTRALRPAKKEKEEGKEKVTDKVTEKVKDNVKDKVKVKETENEQTDRAIAPPNDPQVAKLRNGVRGVMRKIPASVAVLTVASAAGEPKRPVPMGVAVSSLTTVSLDPPLVSFNIKQPSQTLDAIRNANGRFRVHFLRADRAGARVVELFCNGNHPEAYDQREKSLQLHMPAGPKAGPPQILDDAVQAALGCTVTHELTVGDHVVLVAQVSEVEPHKVEDAAIAYVDGRYMRMDGKFISGHGASKQKQDDWSAYDYPFLPGKKEQQDYVRRLEAMIKANSGFLDRRPYEVRQELQAQLALPPNHFGINLDLLVATLKEKAGRKSASDTNYSVDMPIMAEFYGSLSSPQMAQIVRRARALVQADPQCVTYLPYRQFLGNLGVANGANITPSDIMAPLREEGLVGPFQPRTGVQKDETVVFNIEYLEQTEHNIRKYLKTLRYDEAERMRFGKILSAVGEPRNAINHFNRIQDRLRCEAAPELYNTPDIDIRGALTPEEVRVTLRRIVRGLRMESVVAFRTQLAVRDRDRMLQVGVHPLASGIDVPFIIGKIQHIYNKTPHFRDVPAAIEKELDYMFTSSITREDLQNRVKQFVTAHALRATTWPAPDVLAAMSLRENATIAPDTSDPKTPTITEAPHPISGLVLDTLIATSLRAHYGQGTPEENDAIAAFLRDRYGFDVARNATVEDVPAPVKSAGREALDRLEERMKLDMEEMEKEDRERVEEEMRLERERLEQEEAEAREKAAQAAAERGAAAQERVKKGTKTLSGLAALDELEKAVLRAEEEEKAWKRAARAEQKLLTPEEGAGEGGDVEHRDG